MKKPCSGASSSSFCATFLWTIRVNSVQQVRFLLAVFYSWVALCTIKQQGDGRSGRICSVWYDGGVQVLPVLFQTAGRPRMIPLLLLFNSQRTWLSFIYKICCAVVSGVSEYKTKVQAESQLQVTRWGSHRAWTASASLCTNQLPHSGVMLSGYMSEAFLTGEGLSDTYIWHPVAKCPWHINIQLFCLHLDVNGCGNKKVKKNKRKEKWSNFLITWHLKQTYSNRFV